MDRVRQNIKTIRREAGLTQEKFAEKVGIKRSLLGAYEEGRAKPGYDTLIRIANLFSTDLDSLIRGDLAKPTTSGTELNTKVLAITVDPEGRENIELVPKKAAAGYLQGYADPSFIEELPRFNLPFLPQGTFRAFEITGDSMLPIQPGSIIVCEYVEDARDIREGQCYIVVSRDEGLVYKRVFAGEEEGSWIMRSDNPAYPPYVMTNGEIMELWKATVNISYVNREGDVSMERLMSMMENLQQEVIKLQQDKKSN